MSDEEEPNYISRHNAKDRYKMNFKCKNCGNEFKFYIKKGYKVDESFMSDKTRIKDTVVREIVTCPKCETSDKVKPQR